MGVHIVTRRVTTAGPFRASLAIISQLNADYVYDRVHRAEQKSNENKSGGAQHVPPQRPAHRRHERVIASINFNRLEPGVEDAGAKDSDCSKRDDNEQQHGN